MLLIEAVKDGMPMWRRRGWGQQTMWLSLPTMETRRWDRSDPLHPKIVDSEYELTLPDILANDWEYIPLGG